MPRVLRWEREGGSLIPEQPIQRKAGAKVTGGWGGGSEPWKPEVWGLPKEEEEEEGAGSVTELDNQVHSLVAKGLRSTQIPGYLH